MKRRLLIITSLVVLLGSLAACAKPKKTEPEPVDAKTPDEVAGEVVAALEPPSRAKPFFLQFYTPPELTIEAKVPQYELPLKPDEIANWAEASKRFRNKGTAELVLRNGFAVEDGWGKQLGLISSAYENLPEGVPMFVTVDTVLHIQHVLYDQLFSEIEQTYMLADLQAITDAGLDWFTQAYTAHQKSAAASPKQSVAARRNLAYFAVAARLLDPKAAVPKPVEKEVLAELRNIEAGEVAASAIFIYRLDYGQLKPRGHYTQSGALQRYFRAMMWYAQCAFLFQGGRGMIVDAGTADIQTIQALQIARFLVESNDVYARWQRMHAVLGFFAGAMDDVSVADVIGIKSQLDQELAAAGLGGTATGESTYLKLLRQRLLALPPPRIHAATGLPMRDEAATPERRKQWLEQARGMRLFGQRFSLDAYAMSGLTGFTYTGDGRPSTRADTPLGPVRGYPTGLDVMAVLGSKRAEAILRAQGDTEYARYGSELSRLRDEFAQLTDDDWHSSLAMCRLNLVRMLLEPVPDGYPTAMRTASWSNRGIHAALATWAMLKRDTTLDQKKPWSPFVGLGTEVRDYAEPLPPLYGEILGTNRAVLAGLEHFFPELKEAREQPPAPYETGDNITWDEWERQILADHAPNVGPVADFTKWLEQILAISLTELRYEPLDEDAGMFLGSTFFKLDQILGRIDPMLRQPSVITDVFTEPNEGRVLEVGTGRFNLLWIVYQLPSGTKVLGAGPVMSYYEFKQPLDARLTDDEWRDMLSSDKAPDPPAWTKSFLTREAKSGHEGGP